MSVDVCKRVMNNTSDERRSFLMSRFSTFLGRFGGPKKGVKKGDFSKTAFFFDRRHMGEKVPKMAKKGGPAYPPLLFFESGQKRP
jgi:hypothetical protein